MASVAHYVNIIPPNFFQPKKGTTLVEEMECYSLPYGGLGFLSHLLTYYTVTIVSIGRSPLRPWKKLSHSSLDLYLSLFGLIGGFALALFTLVRCRNHWPILLIGIWKLSMSVFNGVVGVHVAVVMRKAVKKFKKKQVKEKAKLYARLPGRDDDDTASSISASSSNAEKGKQKPPPPQTTNVWYWVLLYFPGMIAGFVGLISLIIPNWSSHPKLRIITYVFGGVLGLCICLFCLSMLSDGFTDGLVATIFSGFVTFATLAALYGDWALGAMAKNLLGTPSGDSSGLYWSYFILKRLTMFFS